MPYNEQLADRVRERFAELDNVREISMMGGRCFMYNGKMCVGVVKDELMCRIDPALIDMAVERRGCRQMDMAGRIMKGYVLVDETGYKTKKNFEYWIGLCLNFNKHAKSSKR